MSGVMHLLFLHAFMVWTGTTLPFIIIIIYIIIIIKGKAVPVMAAACGADW
jgi:hypothetical protein